MRTLRMAGGVSIALGAVIGIAVAVWAEEKEEGFKPLGNGKDMSNFKLVGAPESTWTV